MDDQATDAPERARVHLVCTADLHASFVQIVESLPQVIIQEGGEGLCQFPVIRTEDNSLGVECGNQAAEDSNDSLGGFIQLLVHARLLLHGRGDLTNGLDVQVRISDGYFLD